MNWEIMVITLVIFLLVVLAMSVGVIFSDRRIKGSCGGIKAIFGEDDAACSICERRDQCEREKDKSR